MKALPLAALSLSLATAGAGPCRADAFCRMLAIVVATAPQDFRPLWGGRSAPDGGFLVPGLPGSVEGALAGACRVWPASAGAPAAYVCLFPTPGAGDDRLALAAMGERVAGCLGAPPPAPPAQPSTRDEPLVMRVLGRDVVVGLSLLRSGDGDGAITLDITRRPRQVGFSPPAAASSPGP